MYVHVPAIRFNPKRISNLGRYEDDLHRKRNFDLCRAVDTTALKCVLQNMVGTGHMRQEMADVFMLQAQVLRSQLCTENNRSLNF